MFQETQSKTDVAGGGEALAAAAWRSRVADRELAAALKRPQPSGRAVSAHYLDELRRRPRLPGALERDVIAAAQEGHALSWWRPTCR